MNQSSGNAIIAKVRALYGKRITTEQYQDMMNCRTVPEIASYLKNNTDYNRVLENIPELSIHRGQLEELLRRYAFDRYTKIYHFTDNTSSENVFHSIIFELELDQILEMVHLLKAGCPEKFILNLPGYLVSITNLDLLELANVRTFDELLHTLSKNSFGNILKQFKPTEENPSIDYVACEHALYEHHFRRMFQIIEKNNRGAEKRELMNLFGMRLDLINLRTIYRSKAHFHADAQTVSQLVFPFYHRMKPQQIEELIQANSDEQLIKLLEDLFSRSSRIDSIESINDSSIEIYTKGLQKRIYSRGLHLSPYASVAFYCYYNLSKIELNNLIHIIEGIRYKVSKEKIQELLVL